MRGKPAAQGSPAKGESMGATLEDICRMKESIDESHRVYNIKMNEVQEAFGKTIEDKGRGLENTYQELQKQLARLEERVNALKTSQQERIDHMQKQYDVLNVMTDDSQFEAVFEEYKRLQKGSSEGEFINERSLKTTRQRIAAYNDNKTMQHIQTQVQNLIEARPEHTQSHPFQHFRNLVHFLTPVSCHMYIYDVDTNTPSIIQLRDKSGKVFPMKFNSSTLYLNNQIFMIGGTDHLSECGNGCWVYSFLHNYVQKFKDMNAYRRDHSVVFINRHIYSVGGWCEEKGPDNQLIGRGLTASCEKILIDAPGEELPEHWELIKKLNAPKSAVSLCPFEGSGVLYAIGGLAKDPAASYFEKLQCLTDTLPEGQAGRDYSKDMTMWDTVTVTDDTGFYKNNPMVGSLGYRFKDENYILIFVGGNKPEESQAYYMKETERKLLPWDARPNIAGSASLHNRRPLYANNNKDIYFVAFYDILHFQVSDKPSWALPAASTGKWISYK